jgi:arsenite methyltransferase
MLNNFIRFVGNNFGNPCGITGRLFTRLMNIMNQKQYRVVLDNIDLEHNDILLDIGFGNGYLIKGTSKN